MSEVNGENRGSALKEMLGDDVKASREWKKSRDWRGLFTLAQAPPVAADPRPTKKSLRAKANGARAQSTCTVRRGVYTHFDVLSANLDRRLSTEYQQHHHFQELSGFHPVEAKKVQWCERGLGGVAQHRFYTCFASSCSTVPWRVIKGSLPMHQLAWQQYFERFLEQREPLELESPTRPNIRPTSLFCAEYSDP